MSMSKTNSSTSHAAVGTPATNARLPSHDKPFAVMIRAVRYAETSMDLNNWSVLGRYRTRQDALKAIAEHQRDPRYARQFQYKLA